MDKILFATDFSKCAKNAFDYALHTAKITKAKLDIITVSKPRSDKKELFQTQLDELLKEFEPYILENDIHYTTHNKVGNPIRTISEHIQKTNPDLVVVGSRGRSEVVGSTKLLGDTTKKLISRSKTPLISVPTHTKFKSIKNLVFITNRLQHDYFAIIQLLKFASIYNTKVVIAHIDNHHGDVKAKFDEFYDDLSELLNYENFEFKYFNKGSYINGINQIIKEYDAEVLSLVYEKKNFFKKLFNKNYVSDLLVNDYIPLLTLPE